ncbi:sensor histidine kinase [Microvirga lotononidis]|uniref:Blue-light-activated histidine kinase n=1 Tax=Microvirga lotononidis TaxID=864069 RepID=I4YZH1_9HYPH|nr:HWE histidine kinase domain-containing protein [Microvirga lotononidis]EIM29363.1 PAS domain S-box [Microvirga lotononidis]WQO29188.1 HWE histidine kinase domain-containing protein [Microvirga lotononidis]
MHGNLRTAPADFLAGGGEMSALMEKFDWAGTSIGPMDGWPQSLRTTISIMLRSPIPMVLLWGPDGIMIYNDAYTIFAGGRHPRLLGSKVLEGWAEVADFNAHVMRVGMAGGTLSYQDQELTLYRNNVPEQVWMNLDYSPVIDETGKPGGVLAIVVETTERVLAERRIMAEKDRLRELFHQAPGFMVIYRGSDHVFELVNEAYYQLVGRREIIGKPLLEALPEVADQGFIELLDNVYRTKEPFVGHGISVYLQRDASKDPEERFVDFVYQPIRDGDGQITGIFAEGSDVTERVRSEEHQRLLLNELNHRVKNTLATVQSITSQTLRMAGSTKGAQEAIESRLFALSRAHDVLTRENWDGAWIKEVVRHAMQPFQTTGHSRIHCHGHDVRLPPNTTLALAMVLQELATNAVKYGSLSNETGEVQISWHVDRSRERPHLLLTWEEKGGPPVAPPSRRGFGTRLVERSLAQGHLAGEAKIDFCESGVVCTIDAPLVAAHEEPAQLMPAEAGS